MIKREDPIKGGQQDFRQRFLIGKVALLKKGYSKLVNLHIQRRLLTVVVGNIVEYTMTIHHSF